MAGGGLPVHLHLPHDLKQGRRSLLYVLYEVPLLTHSFVSWLRSLRLTTL